MQNNTGRHTGGPDQRLANVASGREFRVRPFEEEDANAWDELVTVSWNGTFLHQRRFASHQGDKHQDLSLVIEDQRGRIVGVLPAALDAERQDAVISHPGLTYGGIVHAGALRGADMLDALRLVTETYRAASLRYLRYKVVPYIYYRTPSSDDLYALFRLGAKRYRCDLSATIDLASGWKLNKLRRRDLNRARRSGVRVMLGSRYLKPYWSILEENLASKYDTRPVHALDEIVRLSDQFPEEIRCMVGTTEDEVVAGVVLFCTQRVAHVQYAATSPSGEAVGAQTLTISHAIEESKHRGRRYFDFGISNEQEGNVLNANLHRFKTSFGAGGVVHEFYELAL